VLTIGRLKQGAKIVVEIGASLGRLVRTGRTCRPPNGSEP